MTVDSLNASVEVRVNEQHDKVIVGVMTVLISRHNDFCGCEYCERLPDYVLMRKQETRLLRMSDRMQYDNRNDELYYREQYVKTNWAAELMKVEKDAIKKEAVSYLQ